MDTFRPKNPNEIPPSKKSKLEAVYETVPKGKEILESVKLGREDFLEYLRLNNLEQYGIDNSQSHSFEDVEVQSFAASIPSSGLPEEIRRKTFEVYAAHWLDDFVDDVRLMKDHKSILNVRHDIKAILKRLGPVGKIADKMFEISKDPEVALRAIHKFIYGGLIPRAPSRELRKKLLYEYMALSGKGIDPDLKKDLDDFDPPSYLITNKIALDLVNGPEKDFDVNVSEIWNRIYVPMIYYHDNEEEKRRGEIHMTAEDSPKEEEMIRIIRNGFERLKERQDPRLELRLEQLKFLIRSFNRVLPQSIKAEYHKLERK